LASADVDEAVLREAARRAEGFSFAQVREAYILAGQYAFRRGADDIGNADLFEGVERVRQEGQIISTRVNGRPVGFEIG